MADVTYSDQNPALLINETASYLLYKFLKTYILGSINLLNMVFSLISIKLLAIIVISLIVLKFVSF